VFFELVEAFGGSVTLALGSSGTTLVELLPAAGREGILVSFLTSMDVGDTDSLTGSCGLVTSFCLTGADLDSWDDVLVVSLLGDGLFGLSRFCKTSFS
jgi:hypothetical protein